HRARRTAFRGGAASHHEHGLAGAQFGESSAGGLCGGESACRVVAGECSDSGTARQVIGTTTRGGRSCDPGSDSSANRPGKVARRSRGGAPTRVGSARKNGRGNRL